MLAKRSRLGAQEVRAVLARGKAFALGPYRGKYLEGRARIGVAVIVSKRDAKTSVERNRLRRAAYQDIKGLVLPKSGSVALFVRPVKAKK